MRITPAPPAPAPSVMSVPDEIEKTYMSTERKLESRLPHTPGSVGVDERLLVAELGTVGDDLVDDGLHQGLRDDLAVKVRVEEHAGVQQARQTGQESITLRIAIVLEARQHLGNGSLASSVIAVDRIDHRLDRTGTVLGIRKADLARGGRQVGQRRIQVLLGKHKVCRLLGVGLGDLPQTKEQQCTTRMTALEQSRDEKTSVLKQTNPYIHRR
jgi:hypothetical protein